MRLCCILNATCYTGITDYEFHYTLYEKGSFYKKHFDQFRNNDSRQYSMIMYLNTNWQKDRWWRALHLSGKGPTANIS
jgi:Rps23 Pro-64 3,4-dihydroxylase Tpa1-like proline 4-hydroxylase